MSKKHVTICLTLDQAHEVRKTIEQQRDTLVAYAGLLHATDEERKEYERRTALLSDSLLEF